jgi:hypothetical protein
MDKNDRYSVPFRDVSNLYAVRVEHLVGRMTEPGRETAHNEDTEQRRAFHNR